ncbi:hypothetical protein D3C80_207780 [compost metagenome]
MHDRVTRSFSPVDENDASEEQHAHSTEDRPALSLVTDHAAEDVGQRRADRKDRHHLDQIGDRIRIFERMRRIGVEETATIGAEHLDRKLRGDRAERDRLFRTFQRRGFHVSAKGLRHAEKDEDQRQQDAERQKQVKRGAGHIDPEIADRFARGAGKTTDQGNRDRDAGRGRQEILDSQPRHLGQIRHGGFAAIVLPVGVGDEADGAVEGEFRPDRGHAGRVERQHILQAEQAIENQHAEEIEHQHGEGVSRPVLLLTLAGAG